jgi:hypothetical protein
MKLCIVTSAQDLGVSFGEIALKAVQPSKDFQKKRSSKAVFFQDIHYSGNTVIFVPDPSQNAPLWMHRLAIHIFPGATHGAFSVDRQENVDHSLAPMKTDPTLRVNWCGLSLGALDLNTPPT